MLGSDRSDPGDARPDRRSCHRCRQAGHLANDCPNRSAAAAGRTGPRACYACGDPSHYIRDCPRKAKSAPKRYIIPGSGATGGGGGDSGGGRPSPAPRVPEGSTPRVGGSSGGGRPSPTPRAPGGATSRAGGSQRGVVRSDSICRIPAGSTNQEKEKEKEKQEERNNGGTKKGSPASGGGQYPAKGSPAGGGGQSRWVRRDSGASSQVSYQSFNRTNSSSSQPPKTPSFPHEQGKGDNSGTKNGFIPKNGFSSSTKNGFIRIGGTKDGFIGIGGTKDGFIGGTKEDLISGTKDGFIGIGGTKDGFIGGTKEGFIGGTEDSFIGIGGTRDGFTGYEHIVDFVLGAYENNSGSLRNNEEENNNGEPKNCEPKNCTPAGGDDRSRWVHKDSSSSSSSSGLSSNLPKTTSSTHEKEKENRGSGSGTIGNRGGTNDGSTGDGSSDLHDSIGLGSVGNSMGIYESNSSSGGSLRNNGRTWGMETNGVIMTGDLSFSSNDTDADEIPVSLTDFDEWRINFYYGGRGEEKSGQNKQRTADGRLRDGNCNSWKSCNNNGVLGSGGPVVIAISSSSSSEDEDEQMLGKKIIGSFATTVRVKEERRKVVEEDDEDCVILDSNPFQPPTVDFEHKLSLSNHEPSGEDEDVCVISERGQVACRDYPHSRHHCAKYPFVKTSHESCCPQCYCYVCDVVAPCEYWSGRGSSGHCHASDCDETWKIIRSIHKEKQRVKLDSLPGSAMPIHPLYNTLPHQLWWD